MRDLHELVRARNPSATVRWPRSTEVGRGAAAQQLLWLRKFRGVRMQSAQAYPACLSRTSTFSMPCEIQQVFLAHPAPATRRRREWPAGFNQTRSRAAFWMAFTWHTQYAHWILEHLPRMWYYLQLCRLLPQPPLIVTPRGLAPWQRTVLRTLPMLGTAAQGTAPLLPLDPPHYFSTLYVPGMPSYIGILWTPQALVIWDRVRQLAGRRGPGSVAEVQTRTPSSNGRFFSFRSVGGHSAGSARVLADLPALAAGLESLGFASLALEELSMAQKLDALRSATLLVVECGSALANGMFLPRGLTLIALCMRQHTSAQGCYSQLLASRFTAAAVHTLRVGEPVDSNRVQPTYSAYRNTKNNVQTHAAWTVSVPHALAAIAALSVGVTSHDSRSVRLEGGEGGLPAQMGQRRLPSSLPSQLALGWPSLSSIHKVCGERGAVAQAQRAMTAAKVERHQATPLRPPHSEWWRSPEEVSATTGEVRSRVFTLLPCPGDTARPSQWASPSCFELRTRRRPPQLPNAHMGAPHLEWRPCELPSHCTKWRWCLKKDIHGHNVLNDENGTLDRNVDCERPLPTPEPHTHNRRAQQEPVRDVKQRETM